MLSSLQLAFESANLVVSLLSQFFNFAVLFERIYELGYSGFITANPYFVLNLSDFCFGNNEGFDGQRLEMELTTQWSMSNRYQDMLLTAEM